VRINPFASDGAIEYLAQNRIISKIIIFLSGVEAPVYRVYNRWNPLNSGIKNWKSTGFPVAILEFLSNNERIFVKMRNLIRSCFYPEFTITGYPIKMNIIAVRFPGDFLIW